MEHCRVRGCWFFFVYYFCRPSKLQSSTLTVFFFNSSFFFFVSFSLLFLSLVGYASFSRLLKLFHVEMKKVGESMRKEAVKKHNDEICSVCNGKKFVYEPAEYTCKEEPLPDTVFLLLTTSRKIIIFC